MAEGLFGHVLDEFAFHREFGSAGGIRRQQIDAAVSAQPLICRYGGKQCFELDILQLSQSCGHRGKLLRVEQSDGRPDAIRRFQQRR
ncbi:hypothetical protein D3C75_907000 [compost metagenome]